jgi:hypothetical protein
MLMPSAIACKDVVVRSYTRETAKSNEHEDVRILTYLGNPTTSRSGASQGKDVLPSLVVGYIAQ